jgi:hypothetical protein
MAGPLPHGTVTSSKSQPRTEALFETPHAGFNLERKFIVNALSHLTRSVDNENRSTLFFAKQRCIERDRGGQFAALDMLCIALDVILGDDEIAATHELGSDAVATWLRGRAGG